MLKRLIDLKSGSCCTKCWRLLGLLQVGDVSFPSSSHQPLSLDFLLTKADELFWESRMEIFEDGKKVFTFN